MTTTAKEIKKEVTLPDNKERFFILHFVSLNRPSTSRPGTRVFPFKGNLIEARSRARNHCEIMNLRYINVFPFIVDLDDIEKRKTGGSYEDQY
jgi:hypothetical protein